VAVVVTKSDALNAAGEDALARHEPVLLALARELDPEAPSIRTAAVGRNGTDPQGLGDLIGWLCSDDRPQAAIPMPDFELGGARSIAAFRA
jgi:predicted Zn-dependent protease